MTEQPVMDRAEIMVRLAKVNAQAKAISRRGRAFQRESESYEDTHANLDWLLMRLGASE